MRATAATITAVTVALTLTGCTKSDPEPTPPTSSPTSAAGPTTSVTEPTAPPTPELVDRSDLVYDFTFPTEVLGESEGTIPNDQAAVLSVHAVEASETTTRLIFGLRSPNGQLLTNISPHSWLLMPTLDDTAAGKRYLVNTYDIPYLADSARRGLYLPPTGRAQGFSPSTAQYPPLDPGTTSVEVTMPGFEPIEVPVTRR